LKIGKPVSLSVSMSGSVSFMMSWKLVLLTV
jgi:hypothetical protein